MNAYAEGCDFRDFIGDAPAMRNEHAGSVIQALQEKGAQDFTSLEALVTHLARLGIETTDPNAAYQVWQEYKLWRVDKIAAVARLTIDERADML